MDFVSVLFIDQLSIGDEGMYSFYIVSSDGYAIPNNNNILVSPGLPYTSMHVFVCVHVCDVCDVC